MITRQNSNRIHTEIVVKYSRLHLKFSSLNASILLRLMRLGESHFAPEVSIGFFLKYAASHRSEQSQAKGFLPKCLEKKTINEC